MTSLTQHNGTSENGHSGVVTSVRSPDPAPTHTPLPLGDLRAEAERLIAGINRPVRRVSLRAGMNAVEVDWETPAEAPVARPAPETAEAPDAPVETPVGTPERHLVTAPLVGTVYLAPEPGVPPFVQPGDAVTAGQQLAIIEAMKLMNPIVADRDGVVAEVRVTNGEMVEFGEALFDLAPRDGQREG